MLCTAFHHQPKLLYGKRKDEEWEITSGNRETGKGKAHSLFGKRVFAAFLLRQHPIHRTHIHTPDSLNAGAEHVASSSMSSLEQLLKEEGLFVAAEDVQRNGYAEK